MSVESSVRIPCSSLYFIHVINSFVFGVKESKSRLHCIFLKLSYLAGLAECFIQKSQPTARQAEYLMVGKVCQLLVLFVSDSCTSSPVTMKHGLQLWQKLSKALEPMGKLVPDSLQKDYPVMNCVTQAVGRFGDLLTVGITREIKINMEGEVDVKALKRLPKTSQSPCLARWRPCSTHSRQPFFGLRSLLSLTTPSQTRSMVQECSSSCHCTSRLWHWIWTAWPRCCLRSTSLL